MRVLYLTGTYGVGGKERQLAELIKSLPRSEFELHLIVKNHSAYYLDSMRDRLQSFHSLDRQRFGVAGLRMLLKHIKKIQPDIVHSWATPTSFLAVLARLLYQKKCILVDGSIRHAPPKINWINGYGLQRKIITRFSDAIVANSRAGLTAYHIPQKIAHCIYNGFDVKRLLNLADVQITKEKYHIRTKYVVGMVGRFEPDKDYRAFIKAAQIVLSKRDDVTFVAVGGGRLLEKMREMVQEKWKERIIFTGLQTEIESIEQSFDIGIMLSPMGEGLSNSLLEYMALKKPVIANPDGGTVELIMESETGIFITSHDHEMLADKIILLLDNPDLRKRMGFAAFQRVEKLFSLKNMVDKYADLYRKLLSQN